MVLHKGNGHEVVAGADWGDPALRRIDEVSNMDVDKGSITDIQTLYVVVDTNILLYQLDLLQDFVNDIERVGLPMAIVIPGIVVKELDFQKNDRSSMRWSARRASTWILDRLKAGRSVRGQAYHETCQQSGKWTIRDKGVENDDLIVDCCLYLRSKAHSRKAVVVLSNDKNLCLTLEAQHIRTISPGNDVQWTSRMLEAELLNEDEISAMPVKRPAQHPSAGPSGLSSGFSEKLSCNGDFVAADDDVMEVDDEYGIVVESDIGPSHPLDILHAQVINHFRILLIDLLKRVTPHMFKPAEKSDGSSVSMHSTHIKNVSECTASDCIGYLRDAMPRALAKVDTRDKNMRVHIDALRLGTSRLASFLAEKSQRGVASRKGQEWSRQDWISCLKTLESIGEVWQEEPIKNSLAQLWPVMEEVFRTPMRPTGI